MPNWMSDGSSGDIGARREYRAEAAIAANLLVTEGTDDGEVDVCGATDVPVGVAPQAIAEAEMGPVCREGDLLVVASEAITRGAWVKPAASGKVAAATAAAGEIICGRANEAATDDGDIVSIRWQVFQLPA
jgi:hypothetical protein